MRYTRASISAPTFLKLIFSNFICTVTSVMCIPRRSSCLSRRHLSSASVRRTLSRWGGQGFALEREPHISTKRWDGATVKKSRRAAANARAPLTFLLLFRTLLLLQSCFALSCRCSCSSVRVLYAPTTSPNRSYSSVREKFFVQLQPTNFWKTFSCSELLCCFSYMMS